MLPSNDPNRGSTSRAARIWPRYSRTRLTFSKMQPDWQCAVAWTRPLPHKSQCFRDFQTQTATKKECCELGRAACRARVWQYVYLSGVAESLKKKIRLILIAQLSTQKITN